MARPCQRNSSSSAYATTASPVISFSALRYDPAMPALTDVSAFILAGGKSTRMGTDKAFVTLGGRPLLDHALTTARSVAGEVRIVGASTKFAAFAPVVEDTFVGCGPLAGIHAALRASQTDLNIILAVDLPFLPPTLLHFLIGKARHSTASLVIVPRTLQRWQPLCAVYRRSFADLAETALRSGRYKIDTLFAETEVRVVEKEEFQAAGFSPEIFRNLNTPEELSAAQS
jgi:molybdenum cofactor guanylyltransferase